MESPFPIGGLSKRTLVIRVKKVSNEQQYFRPQEVINRPPEHHLTCVLYHSELNRTQSHLEITKTNPKLYRVGGRAKPFQFTPGRGTLVAHRSVTHGHCGESPRRVTDGVMIRRMLRCMFPMTHRMARNMMSNYTCSDRPLPT